MIEGHGGNIYEIARALKCSPWEILDMSSNVSPLGIPPGLQAILEKGWHEIVSLPEVDSEGLRTNFAISLGLAPDQVLAGNGTTEFIYTFPPALKTKKALIVGPTYADYADACRAYGIEPAFLLALEEADFQPDLEDISSKLVHVDTVFICNPNNPTGQLLPAESLKQLAETHPTVSFVVDESYLPFVPDWESQSLARTGTRNVIVLQSFSKVFVIPGLRLGFLIASPEIIRAFGPFRHPWSVNRLAQLAGSFLVSQHHFVKDVAQFCEIERAAFLSYLEGLDLLVSFPSAVHFILFKLNGTLRADKICTLMARHKILIRDCSNFYGLSERFIRIALKGSEANMRCAEILKEMLG